MRSNKYRKNYKKSAVPKTIKRYVRKLIKDTPEDKTATQLLSSVHGSIGNAWNSVSVANFSQGVNAGNRLGRRIRVTKLVIDGWLAAGDNSNFVRLIVCSADNAPFSGATIDADFTNKQGANGLLERIHYDRTFFLKYSAVDGSSATQVAVPRHVRIVVRPNLLIRWSVYLPYDWDCTVFRGVPVCVTLCLWLDTKTNGAAADSSEVFGNYAGSAMGNVAIQRALNLRDRFRVYRQEVFYLPQNIAMNDVNLPSFTGSFCPFEWFIPLDGLQMRYKDASFTVSSVIDNSFHISAFSTVAPYHIITNPINGPVLDYSVSARYFSGPV